MALHAEQDARSLALHREAIRLLKRHPELVAKVREVLDHWDQLADPHSKPLRDEWRRIVDGRLWRLATARTQRGYQLRQASPLGFVVDAETRARILRRSRQPLAGVLARIPSVGPDEDFARAAGDDASNRRRRTV